MFLILQKKTIMILLPCSTQGTILFFNIYFDSKCMIYYLKGDIHTHVAMLSINTKLIISNSNPTFVMSVVVIKVMSANLSNIFMKNAT